MGSAEPNSPEKIRAELERVLASAPFANSQRSQRFLRYVVEASLNNVDESLKEFAIAVDVFGRNTSYDPSIDAAVRVEAGRLRTRLREYYADGGNKDPIVIDVPKGGYRATFTAKLDPPSPANLETLGSTPPVLPDPKIYKTISWAGISVVLVVALAGLALWRKPASHPAPPVNGPKVLAVLPFTNQTGATANNYLTEGITETLIRQFSLIPQLRVISRAAADRVNKQNAASELGIGYLLTGALERNADGRLVLNAELSDAKNGAVLGSKQYIPDETDLRPIQAEIVQDAVKGLGIPLTAQIAGAKRPLTSSPAAFQSFLRGEGAARLRDNPANLHEAIHDFEEAVRLDPTFAFAYSSMAEAHLGLGMYYEPPRDHMPLARQYAQRTLVLDPSLHQAHSILGLIDLVYDWNFAAGQSEEDLESMLEFDPHSVMLIAELGCVNYYAGHYDDSIHYYQQALTLDPRSILANWGMARVLARESRYKEALDRLKQVKKLNGFEPPIITAEIGFTEAASGDRQAALQTLKQLKEESEHAYVDSFLMAVVYLGLKDRENTYAWLERAYQARSPFLVSLATDPKWSDSRSDSRFEALWNRMTNPPNRSSAQTPALGAL